MMDTMASETLSPEHEARLGELLNDILARFAGAIEFWTLVCLTQRDLGDPRLFIDQQSMGLLEQIQALRQGLYDEDYEPSEAVIEQVVKLNKVGVELRDLFDFFITANRASQRDLEAAVMKLAQIWQDVRMRVWLLGAVIPLAEPPALPMEKEAFYQSILDGLFDQFLTARASIADIHERNGKVK